MPSLGIRGANPIWLMVNLWGKLFDDTYYMWVLENQIPYIPASVFHDPDLSVEWTDPIQFLGNGTLPNDIYFEPNTVYRLEFRQHIGLGSPSQADPLIYLVENYVPGEGGSTPVDTIATQSSNQITNPQFALINFNSPYSYTGPAASLPIAGKIKVAPGWFLNLGGTGTVTVTKVPLNNAEANPTNAPYALRITMNGWTAGSVFLSQRFEQNGMLWANQFVSSAITASLGPDELPQNISAQLVDSNSTLLGTILPLSPVVPAFNEFTGYAQLPATSNPNIPPAAYIEYQLLLPSNIDIYVTSIQVVVEDMPVEPSFEQDSINRQIDHTYNTAYPIVPVGTIIDSAAYATPLHYLPTNGAAILRNQYQLLLTAIAMQQSVVLTASTNTFVLSNAALLYIGIPLEGTGIPASTTVTNIVGTTVTISNNATVTGTQIVTFFPWGNGDGSTTFNVPLLNGYATAGAGGSLFATNGMGNKGGANTGVLVAANIPAHTHKTTVPVQGSISGFGYANGTNTTSQTFTSDGGESLANVPLTTPPSPFTTVQPTALVNKFIRYE